MGARPDPWQPWDSMAVFKVRHLDMGPWKAKLWRAKLLRFSGPTGPPTSPASPEPHPLLIVPPAAEYRGARLDGLRGDGAPRLGDGARARRAAGQQ